MKDDEFYSRAADAKTKARATAIDAAMAYKIGKPACVSADIPNVFGEKWANKFAKERKNLIDEYSEQFESLITLSVREYIYSKVNASSFMLALYESAGGARDDDYARLTTPDGYANSEGWAYTLYNSIAEIDPHNELLQGTQLNETPCRQAVLTGMAIVWFFDASLIFSSSNKNGMDILFEAADALELANGMFMWDEGEKVATESIRQQSGDDNPAAALAKLRHRENYAFAEYALKFWRDNISPDLSAQKAATELTRVVPLSHKKLAEIVSLEKNKGSRLRRTKP